MKSYDLRCPICGTVNRGLYLEETDGWMECEKCGNVTQSMEHIRKRFKPEPGQRCVNRENIVYCLDFTVTPHQLRHTYITNLIYAGVDPKTVQYLAGHENSKVTMDIYAKVKYNKPEELSGVVNDALKKMNPEQRMMSIVRLGEKIQVVKWWDTTFSKAQKPSNIKGLRVRSYGSTDLPTKLSSAGKYLLLRLRLILGLPSDIEGRP